MGEVGYFEILYEGGSNPIEIKRGEESLLGKKGIKKKGTHDASTIKSSSVIRDKFHQFCISFWRHGRVVRRGTANPFSPVQIRVSPAKDLKFLLLFCWYNSPNYFSSEAEERGYWYLFDSKHSGGDFRKDCKSLNPRFKEIF